MKRLLILFGLLLTLSVSAQIDYPRYEKDSLGQQVVVMTMQQAMKLDNNSELLGLFEKLNSQLGEYDSICVKVINDKEKVINAQKIEIASLKKALTNKDAQIENLQQQIVKYIDRVGILEQQIENREAVISEKNLQIQSLKTKMIFGGIGGGVAIIGLVLGILLIH
jgi:uncharacterized protein (DUF3084 family)